MRSRNLLFAVVFAVTPVAFFAAVTASCSNDEPPPPLPPKDSGVKPDYYVDVQMPPQCDGGLMMCSPGMCIDINGSDPMNCGNCNKACPMNATCSGGKCSTEPAVMATGGLASYVALIDGTMYSWGGDQFGQTGDDPNNLLTQCMNDICRYQPVIMPGVMDVISIGAGWDHVCAAQKDGKVFCWGANAEGQLGHNPNTDQLCGVLPDGGMILDAGAPTICNWVPTQVTLPGKAIQVVAGKGFTCARLDTKDVYCWGTNTGSITGRAAAGFDFNPNKLSAFASDVEDIAVAGPTQVSHGCGRRTDGSLWCWGKNDFGQLGNASPSSSAAPIAVAGLAQIAQFAMGEFNTCAYRQNGDSLCWGSNARGGLGDPNIMLDATPHPTPAKPNMKWGITTGMFAGMATRFARDSADQWYVWGVNLFGTYGDGTTMAGMCGNDVCDPNPKIDSKLFGFRTVITADHALGISKGGKLFSWGRNDVGQLGKQPGGTDSSCMGGIFCNPTPSTVQGLP